MSASEHEFSESSNLDSPQSQSESPHSSPSQQVPHLTNVFSGISCNENFTKFDSKRPYLRMIEQPQNYFRFRYKSEMVGTHGCLLGKTASANKAKTHPTVELVNYTGNALIRCRLSQPDKDDEHPHKLLEDEQEDRDVSTMVPEQGSYKVGFAGMGIIHTAKKDVPGLLLKKYMDNNKNADLKKLRSHCENVAKTINLNIVRLRFSAHDIHTDKEICPPVFSEPIHNMKSAATNDLKICRISRCYGRPRGGDDVFILVEKVNKKNVVIRFFELDEYGNEVWTATGSFLQSDVHHQYAIVFRTPPYRDPNVTRDVKVCIELVRPSDGRTSEPKEFVYKASQMCKQNKRRRVHSSYSSLESCSGDSIKSLYEVPITVEMLNQNDRGDEMPNMPFHINLPPTPAPSTSNSDLVADALFYGTASDSTASKSPQPQMVLSPMLSQPYIPEPPVIQLNSTELERLINHDPHIPSEERKRFCESDWTEYMRSFGESLPDKTNSMDYIIRTSLQLAEDSGGAKDVVKKEPESPMKPPAEEIKKSQIVEKCKGNNTYDAFYKAADGDEVKKLVKEICEIIKNKGSYKKQVVRDKLERLFEMRLSNGDTFLHMALSSNQPSFKFIIKLIHSMKMPHLLNLTNDLSQSILHLAVISDLPQLVTFLVSKGCNPMVGDIEGNNVIHYAVICKSCLGPLLNAIKTYDVACDLNAQNFEKQTALHLADSGSSARLLLQHGASYNARDSEGRTPLHLATYDDSLDVAGVLLDFMLPCDIDAIDGRGNTALQIVCGRAVKQNSLAIVKLLLEKKADPLKHEEHNQPAWRLASDKPELWETMQSYAPTDSMLCEEEIKSEPEDDFESADEGEYLESGLSDLPLYIGEVSALLDASGAWQQLAARLHMHSLTNWYRNTRSPTRTLLNHVKDSGDSLTSKSLAMYLLDMGEVEAAKVIRRCISSD